MLVVAAAGASLLISLTESGVAAQCQVVATVNNQPICLADMQLTIDQLMGLTSLVPSDEALTYPEAYDRVLSQTITNTVLSQEVSRRGISVTEDAVADAEYAHALERSSSPVLTTERIAILQHTGQTPTQWGLADKAAVADSLRLNTLLDQLASGATEPTEAEIQAYLSAANLKKHSVSLMEVPFATSSEAANFQTHLLMDAGQMSAEALARHTLEHALDLDPNLTTSIEHERRFNESSEVPAYVVNAMQLGIGGIAVHEDPSGSAIVYLVTALAENSAMDLHDLARSELLAERRRLLSESAIEQLIDEADIQIYP
jgi:hypothetical protein